MILGITPARGGSKTIPKKNIKEICGKPLIAWTIEAAKKSKLLDRYVVSTEDKEIAEISRKYGAEVISRPRELATDEAKTLSVLKDVLKKIRADIVVLLQCTSPIREEGLIDYCIQKFLDSKSDSLATGFVCKLYEWGKYGERRQDLKGWFHDDGNVYVLKANLIERANSLDEVWGKKMEKVIISKEQNFEIEDEFDFWLNEKILKRRYGNKI
jgi:N-acylneuraminate cytidylyltransferase